MADVLKQTVDAYNPRAPDHTPIFGVRAPDHNPVLWFMSVYQIFRNSQR